ncbi:MAG TPA: peptidoglycan editing factor PgeF [Patescibacteria group bacterium]|nr:peptidoglycan editing factor PgeF [Patescibacteria group bacterium]
MSFTLQQSDSQLWYGYFPALNIGPVIHGISTRTGGRSKAPYSSLNLGMHIGDDGVAVRLNRQLFCNALGIQAERVVTAEQVHGTAVAVIDQTHAGRGALDYSDSIPAADALITNVPGIPLMLFFADCVPILIVDPVNWAVGVVHAGWKGTAGSIVAETLQAMHRRYGTEPRQCLAGIGPAIGPCCYEVDENLAGIWRQRFPHEAQLLVPRSENRWLLDLWSSNRWQLEECGLASGHIYSSSTCTACHTSHFFSHRAEMGSTGRHGALIALRNK